MKFRKKPVIIEAMQFNYPPSEKFLDWIGVNLGQLTKARHPGAVAEAEIKTLEDGFNDRVQHIATEGDWIIKGVKGEFYPCKPDIFEATYEQVGIPETRKPPPPPDPPPSRQVRYR